MTTSTPVRVLVADDHAVVRLGLRLLLDREPQFEVVAEAGDGLRAMELASSADVGLAILDVAMPRMTGLQAARELSRHRPGLPIVMLSMYDDEQFKLAALRAGAGGYVLKSSIDQDIVAACREVVSGGRFGYPSDTRALAWDLLGGRSDRPEQQDVLTPRELEVVKLIAEGASSKEIARLLVISIKTVERHRTNVLSKLGFRDRVALTRYAIRRGLIEP